MIEVESTFDSFQDAVAHSSILDRELSAKQLRETFVGVSFVDYRISRERLELATSDGRVLRLFAIEGIVDWSVDGGVFLIEKRTIYDDFVDVTLDGVTSFVWKPHDTLSRIMNVPNVFMSCSETFVFISARGCPEVMLNSHHDIDANGPFLMFEIE